MKKLLTILALLPLLAYSQCLVQSTQGYQVHLAVQPLNLLITNNGGGCTYKVQLQYTISFSGSNQPGSLYTLQGTIGCGSQQVFFDLPNNGGTGFTTTATGSYNGDCSQLTLSNFCSQVNIQIQGPGIPYQTISCTYSLLPILLTEFKSVTVNGSNIIKWVQESNTSVEEYQLERSVDMITWTKLADLEAFSGGYQYFVTDSNYENGVNYYRLMLDGEEYGVISIDNTLSVKIVSATYNLLGEKVDQHYRGWVVEFYEDSTTQLKFQ